MIGGEGPSPAVDCLSWTASRSHQCLEKTQLAVEPKLSACREAFTGSFHEPLPVLDSDAQCLDSLFLVGRRHNRSHHILAEPTKQIGKASMRFFKPNPDASNFDRGFYK
jgi:hypothetical protein